MANFYDLEPAEQQRLSLARLFRYLRTTVARYHPYLRRLYRERGIDFDALRTLDDLRRLPIVDKNDFRDNALAFILRPYVPDSPPPEGFDTEPLTKKEVARYVRQALLNRPPEYSQLVRRSTFRERVRRRALLEWNPIHFHASTGTTGNPTPATYTHYDFHHILPQLASLLILPKKRDPEEPYYDWTERAMNVFPGAPHLAFFTPVLAKMAAGASSFETFGGHVIPTDRQIALFAEGGFTSMTAVPSYLIHWLRRALVLQEEGKIGPLNSFRRVIVGAEPLSESMREYVRSLALKLGAHPRFRILQSLGMTEMRWAFIECAEHSGMHLDPRHYYWELLDPETREPVPEGEPGVLCFTHIGWRGTVLVRYWTGDLIKGGMRWDRCQHCGYTFPRIYPPICRAEKDFTKIKGARVDLSVLIESVRDTPGVRNFQVVLEDENPGEEFSRDLLSIHVAAEPSADPGAVETEVRRRVKYYTEVSADHIVFEPNEADLEKRLFARNGIKAEYVVERRTTHI